MFFEKLNPLVKKLKRKASLRILQRFFGEVFLILIVLNGIYCVFMIDRLGDHGTLREEVEKTDNYEVEIVPVTPEQIRLISIEVFQKRYFKLFYFDSQ